MQLTSHGSAHWWRQRLTAVAMVPLTLFFCVSFLKLQDASFVEIVEFYQNPLNTMVSVGFIIVAVYHAWLGVRVIIDDYIHSAALRIGLIVANTMYFISLGMVGIFSIFRLAFYV
jgi:succinate dehydrogenase / fumarate reductase membrane anchor subunit